ncbi:MAG: ABC transporter permease [Candidatus Micrarchaeaceae archaeon]
MSLLGDAYNLYMRDMLIFKKNWKTSIARSIIFPVTLILLLGNLGTNISHAPIAIVNLANNPEAISFVSYLNSQNALSVYAMTNQQQAMLLLSEGDVTSVVVLPQNFGSKDSNAIYIYTDVSSPIASEEADAAIDQAAAQFGVKASLQSIGISAQTNYVYGASSSYKTFLIAGIVVMVAAFGSMWSGGFTLITDRQLGNLKAFMATPIQRLSILLGKMTYGISQSMISGLLALGIGIAYGGTIAEGSVGILPIIWFMFLSAVGFSGVATALGTRINKVEVYSLIGMAITLPLWILSGAFMPTSTLPSFMQPFSVYNPMTYSVDAVRDVMLKGFIPVSAFLVYSLILIGFAIATVAISLLMFRKVNAV